MYLFVSSPGRSGTKYLSEIFKRYTDLAVYHGGEKLIRDVINNKMYVTNNLTYIPTRLELIKQLNVENKGYVETNQIFIHFLVNGIINNKEFTPLYVINLIRNPLEVAISYTNRNSYPSNPKSIWRQPLDSSSRLLKTNGKNFTIFQENLIDWIDTQMKFEKYKNSFDRYYELKFTDLNDENKIVEMFNFFDIKYDIKKKQCNMKKNENKKKTIITSEYIRETSELLTYLKTLKNCPENIIKKYF